MQILRDSTRQNYAVIRSRWRALVQDSRANCSTDRPASRAQALRASFLVRCPTPNDFPSRSSGAVGLQHQVIKHDVFRRSETPGMAAQPLGTEDQDDGLSRS